MGIYTRLQVFTMLNRLGLCKCSEASRRVVDSIRQEFDATIKRWQTTLSNSMAEINQHSTSDPAQLRTSSPDASPQPCSGDSSCFYGF